MALIKRNAFFTSLLVLVALFGVAVGGTVHKVGDSSGWTMMGANYEAWASSRTFQVGDSLVFEYNNDFHDVTEVTHNDFVLCESSKPLAKYETGFDTISLTKPGLQNFICGVPGHCDIGQKLQILVLPASLGPVAAPFLDRFDHQAPSLLRLLIHRLIMVHSIRWDHHQLHIAQLQPLAFGSDSASFYFLFSS
ncbi:unnamed protein product [Thlaspi arvense]|uniref:Phytocyanin domain-containing protein n=1 Tax=Thlaspi arvense TaxID=13288 RepID=A0AAU9S7Y9_THLAR|nr:unnamed protein product [Thlaspi arvense]